MVKLKSRLWLVDEVWQTTNLANFCLIMQSIGEKYILNKCTLFTLVFKQKSTLLASYNLLRYISVLSMVFQYTTVDTGLLILLCSNQDLTKYKVFQIIGSCSRCESDFFTSVMKITYREQTVQGHMLKLCFTCNLKVTLKNRNKEKKTNIVCSLIVCNKYTHVCKKYLLSQPPGCP